MSTTPRPPLLSDEEISDEAIHSPEFIIPLTTKMVRDVYEAARAKDAELIQRLVNALEGLVYLEFCTEEGLSSGAPTAKEWKAAFDKAQAQIDAAASAGFKPTEP